MATPAENPEIFNDFEEVLEDLSKIETEEDLESFNHRAIIHLETAKRMVEEFSTMSNIVDYLQIYVNSHKVEKPVKELVLVMKSHLELMNRKLDEFKPLFIKLLESYKQKQNELSL